MSNDGHCLAELGGGGGGEGGFLGKSMNKIEYEGIGTCVRIQISQDADNADQTVKWFLKVHKTYKLLWENLFSTFPQVFIHGHILQIFRFSPP